MKRELSWALISCAITILTLGACSPSAVSPAQTKSGAVTGAIATTSAQGSVPTPVYGGTLTAAITSGYASLDPATTASINVGHMFFTSSKLIQGDWTKGPQGAGQTSWAWGYLSDVSLLTGELASSWELPDSTTIIYHINPNAHYFINPQAAANSLVNGRAVTAQDVAWNICMQFNYPGLWQTNAYPPTEPAKVTDKILPGDPRRPTSVTAIDAHTVQVKVPATSQGIMLLEIGCNMYTNPPEVWTKSDGMTNWKNVIGSSAWILSDYVSDSKVTYAKNPDYWETDPLYPGKNYKWPYADQFVQLVIPDTSTLTASIRTGKVDFQVGLSHDNAMPLINSLKNLQWKKRIGLAPILNGNINEKPFSDIRVRQALNMAIDKQSWLNNYLSGDGELLGYPYPSDPDWSKYYTPLNEEPADVQELYTYNPDKAKQLLADAGYPNGFETSVTVNSAGSASDEVSMLASYLAKVGVTLKMNLVDPSTWFSMFVKRQYSGMWYGSGGGIWAPDEQLNTKNGMGMAYINDPYYAQVGDIIAKDMVSDPATYFKTMKEEGVHELQSAWGIFLPAPYGYDVWWPWVGNYDGIAWTGWAGSWQWVKSIWIDQNMKKSMGF